MEVVQADRSVDVAIVGAGAAGLATAIFTARRLPRARIAALDSARKLGAKILISGGGRCNVTNRTVAAGDYCGGSRHVIQRVLDAFPAADAVAFFREIGVELHEEERGKLFPDSNKARTVLDALLAEARRLGVALLTDHRVEEIIHDDHGFHVVTPSGRIAAACVVLASGGKSYPKTGSDGHGYRLAAGLGHTLIPPTPALAALVLDGTFHDQLSGISQETELTVRAVGKPIRIRGPMLWTHFGASGPAAMDASRHWHRAVLEGTPITIAANFCPGYDPVRMESRLVEMAQSQPRAQLSTALSMILPSRLADALLHAIDVSGGIPMSQLRRESRRAVAQALTQWPLPVKDSRGYNHAEATAGGVPLTEIEPHSMASRRCRGLFLVGEVLDVDGRIGGFNFQWAWSSASCAARGLAEALSPQTTPTSVQPPGPAKEEAPRLHDELATRNPENRNQ